MSNSHFKFNTTQAGFPDPLAPPEIKESKAYIMQYGKNMYNSFTRSGLKILYNKRAEYRELVRYAQGKQSIDQYKKRLDCFNDRDGSWVNLNWEILNLGTKFVNVVVGKLNKTELSTTCTPIDSLALDEKKNYEATIKTHIELGSWMKNFGLSVKDLNPDLDPSTLPSNNEELAIHMQMNYKHRMALEMEQGLDAALNWNEYDQVKKEAIYDLVTVGAGAIKVEPDPKTGFPKIRAVDVENITTAMSETEDFSNVQHIGEVRNLTWAEFVENSSGQFTDEELKDIRKRFSKGKPLSTNAAQYENEFDMNYTQDMINVFDFVYKANDEITHEKKTDKRNNPKFYRTHSKKGSSKEYKEKYKDGSRKIVKARYESVYKGVWIVGSDYIYNYGKTKDRQSEKGNLANTFLPYIMFLPNYKDGRNTSLVEQMKPLLDSIQLNWLKLQDAIAKAVPKGADINMEALENLALGSGGKNLTPRQALDLYYKRGITISRPSGASGRNRQQAPNIQERENGMARDVMNFMDLIHQDIGLIRDLTGVNESMDASTPNPKLGKAVSEMAIAGGNNALDYLYHSMIKMHEKVCQRTVMGIQCYVQQKGNHKMFKQTLGKSSFDFWKNHGELANNIYGIKIEVKPDQVEWERFYQSVDLAVSQQTITSADVAVIYELDNLKQARQYLAFAEKKNRDRVAQEAQAASEQNMQAQMASNQQAEEMKRQTMIMQGDLDMKLAIQNGQNSILAIREKYILENEGNKEQAFMKSGQIQQQGEIEVTRDILKNAKQE